ncbi:MAG: HIT family protein [Bacteroidales bacterium]
MASIFSKIIAGEIPCYKVAESDRYFAFLDISPLAKGHTLVVPKTEIDYIFDMTDEDLGGLMAFAKKVAKAIIQVCPAPKIGMSVIGLEVPHAHIHLVPIHGVNDIDFKKEKLKLSQADLEKIAKEISAVFQAL